MHLNVSVLASRWWKDLFLDVKTSESLTAFKRWMKDLPPQEILKLALVLLKQIVFLRAVLPVFPTNRSLTDGILSMRTYEPV